MARRAEARVALLGALLALAACVAVPAVLAQPSSEYTHSRRFPVTGPAGSRWTALAVYPKRRDRLEHPPGERYPVVIALHGQRESERGPERGFLGFATDYGLSEAFGALGRGRLEPADLRGFVSDSHLAAVNHGLARERFQGVMVVTPYVPDFHGNRQLIVRYGDWLAGPFLDAVRERFEGAARTRAATGIDGISAGGLVALDAGLRHPEVFASVGAIQPAIDGEVERLQALATASPPQHLRLASSNDDPFLGATRELSEGLRSSRVSHDLVVTPGPHGYEYNRGPGVVELLRFHDRVLARPRIVSGD